MNKATLRTALLAVMTIVAVVAMLAAGALLAPARLANAQDATPVPAAEPTAEAAAEPATTAPSPADAVMPAMPGMMMAQGQAMMNSLMPRTITVVGEGKVKVEPDIARINIGVETLRASVREATDANNEMVDAVLAAITETGVAREDIQTSGFNVYAERFGADGPLPEDQVNYRVSNAVNVVVRDLTAISAVLDAAINAGANNIYGIEFALDDTTAVEAEARAAAVESANAKAADLASLTGVTVGRVVSVSEVIGAQPFFNGFRSSMDTAALGGGGPSIQPGQLSLTMQLQVVYEITGDVE